MNDQLRYLQFPCLKIYALGGLCIEYTGEPCLGFVSHKVQALLLYLAYHPREHPREVLQELLWSDLSPQQSMNSLRVALANLQKIMPGCIVATRQSVRINVSTWIDAAVLEADLTAVERHWEQVGKLDCASALDETVSLYTGEFLEGFHLRGSVGFESWQLLQQERLRTSVAEALSYLVVDALNTRRYAVGIRYAGRLLQLDPLREQAHQLMMQLLAFSGRRTAALAQYETCRSVLDRELGVMPSADTVAIYRQIRGQQIAISELTMAQ